MAGVNFSVAGSVSKSRAAKTGNPMKRNALCGLEAWVTRFARPRFLLSAFFALFISKVPCHT
jgi:hypothetical protein